MAETETAKSLLNNLSALLTSIEATNKPQTANIQIHGGFSFTRFIAIALMAVGALTIAATLGLLVFTMMGLPPSTGMSLRIIAATPSLGGLFSGLMLLGLGAITKVVTDSADYNAQLLRLTRRRMEKRQDKLL